MKISRIDERTVALSRVDLLCSELLHQIAVSAELDDPAVHERLFSSPTTGKESEFEEDWQRYVHPGLRHLFQTSLQVVRDDLKGFPPSQADENYTLRIPLNHLDAWVHSLNQARLALAAHHNFTEQEMEAVMPIAGDARSLALFQVHFYGFLLECFLRELDRGT